MEVEDNIDVTEVNNLAEELREKSKATSETVKTQNKKPYFPKIKGQKVMYCVLYKSTFYLNNVNVIRGRYTSNIHHLSVEQIAMKPKCSFTF